MSTNRRLGSIAIAFVLILAACGSSGGGSGAASGSAGAAAAKGPIKIWYSNNAEEVAWGKAVVDAWNKDHAERAGHRRGDPGGQELRGGHRRRRSRPATRPCLIFNTAPAAVPQFQKQGGLVALDDFPDAAAYIAARTGDRADQYKFTDGKFYQMPWKTNPVMIFYNKKVFAKAGIATDNPPLKTYADFLATAKTLVAKGGVQAAIWPSADVRVLPALVRLLPAVHRPDRRQAAGRRRRDRSSRRPTGWPWPTSGSSCTPRSSSPTRRTRATPSPTGRPPWRSSDRGPSPSTATRSSGVPCRSRPRTAWTPRTSTRSATRSRSACTSSCTEPRDGLGVPQVRDEQGQRRHSCSTLTGQMPMRTDLVTTYADYFKAHPEYEAFADQASRTVEVPIVPNSVEMWQTFRTAYSESVIFGKTPIEQSFNDCGRPRSRRWSAGAEADGRRGRQPRGRRTRKLLRTRSDRLSRSSPRTSLFLVALFGYPLLLALYISFFDYFFAAPGAVVDRPFVGLRNYTEVLGDPAFQRAILNVAEFILINVPLTVLLSLVLASALNAKLPFRAFFRTQLLHPLRDGQRRGHRRLAVAVLRQWAGELVARPAGAGARRGSSTMSGRCR